MKYRINKIKLKNSAAIFVEKFCETFCGKSKRTGLSNTRSNSLPEV